MLLMCCSSLPETNGADDAFGPSQGTVRSGGSVARRPPTHCGRGLTGRGLEQVEQRLVEPPLFVDPDRNQKQGQLAQPLVLDAVEPLFQREVSVASELEGEAVLPLGVDAEGGRRQAELHGSS